MAAAQNDLPAAQQPALPSLTIIAPAAPGGGWDQLTREMQREIERQSLAAVLAVEADMRAEQDPGGGLMCGRKCPVGSKT